MKNRLILSIALIVLGLAQCLAQVPDSVRPLLQLPVAQESILPTDSLEIRSTTDSIPAQASAIDTTKADSLAPEKKPRFLHRTFKADYPNPNKALVFSLVFPAGGQLYNKRWWKAPIIWGGYTAFILSLQNNADLYRRLRDAYKLEVKNLPHEFDDLGYDAGDLKRLRDQYDKKRQLNYIGMLGLHLAQSAEAFVDCHLKTFDVSDDLSLRVKPSILASPLQPYPIVGIGFAFGFSN